MEEKGRLGWFGRGQEAMARKRERKGKSEGKRERERGRKREKGFGEVATGGSTLGLGWVGWVG